MIDIAVIGGGISGLYTAYRYLKRHPTKRVILLEKYTDRLGGRIHTYHDSIMDVEIGAGRINSQHRLVMGLVKELGLQKQLVEIGKDNAFMSTKTPGHKIHSVLEIVSGQALASLGIVPLKRPSMPFDELIAVLVKESKRWPKHRLQSMTFQEYAKSVIGNTLVQVIIDTFGYYSEIVIMNAYDALRLMRELDPTNRFYVLDGGLSLIIDRLEAAIRKMGGEILFGKNENESRQVASLTKIMTAHIVIKLLARFNISEHAPTITVLRSSTKLLGTSADLVSHDSLSTWELLHGMMLPSGNDAAQSLAVHFGLLLLKDRCRYLQHDDPFVS